MQFMKVAPALAAIGVQVVAAQEACSASTYTITAAAQATAIDCETMQGSVEISSDVEGELIIDGPSTIRGDLTVTNATSLNSIRSTSLQTIEGKFQMIGLTTLSRVDMTDLTTIGEIEWITLPAFGNLQLGTAGITSAETVTISDTDLQSLDDLNIASVDTMNVNNNARLTSYSTQLGNVSTALRLQSNGDGLNVTFANLIWANELIILNAASVEVPSLEVVNSSLRFDQNTFTSFSAPNLTRVGDDDISFINNEELTNLSFPLLESIGGSLTIINNTKLEEIDGFPELETIGGAIRFGGNFSDVELPALSDVRGAFTILSTDDIGDSCDNFNDMEGSEIRGEYECRGDEDEANEGNFSDNGGNGGSSNNDDDSAGNLVSSNVAAMVVVALAGVIAPLMV